MLLRGLGSYPVCGKKTLQSYYFTLDEVTDDLVVEVFNGSPSDSLLHIFLLKQGRRKCNTINMKRQHCRKKIEDELG